MPPSLKRSRTSEAQGGKTASPKKRAKRSCTNRKSWARKEFHVIHMSHNHQTPATFLYRPPNQATWSVGKWDVPVYLLGKFPDFSHTMNRYEIFEVMAKEALNDAAADSLDAEFSLGRITSKGLRMGFMTRQTFVNQLRLNDCPEE